MIIPYVALEREKMLRKFPRELRARVKRKYQNKVLRQKPVFNDTSEKKYMNGSRQLLHIVIVIFNFAATQGSFANVSICFLVFSTDNILR